MRAYKEHHCNFIFRIQELNLGKVAMLFGILQLPNMPDVKRLPKQNLADFRPSAVNHLDVPERFHTQSDTGQIHNQEGGHALHPGQPPRGPPIRGGPPGRRGARGLRPRLRPRPHGAPPRRPFPRAARRREGAHGGRVHRPP